MEFDAYLEQVRKQATALRAAAVSAGPDTEVPSCPGWTVRRLVSHIARVHDRVLIVLDVDPADEPPKPPRPPEDWDTLLAYWDDKVATMLAELARRGPGQTAWAFPGFSGTSFWARRQAHETAIHRLDAEHALAGLGPTLVHELIFDPELAADGIDEMLDKILPLGDWSQAVHAGTVLYHAPDAGRAWLVTYRPGEPPVTEAPHGAALEVDATVAGTADAVYRRVWGRPSTALVTGDAALAAVAAGR